MSGAMSILSVGAGTLLAIVVFAVIVGDRDEMPFNRATRAWVYRVAKKEDGSGIIGFGSTYDMKAPGAILFVNAAFPVQEWEKEATPPLIIGE